MLRWRWGVVGLWWVAMSGCEEPALIVPAAPPGAESPRPLPSSEREPEAIGELAGHNPASDKAREEFKALPPTPPTAKGETRTTTLGVRYETLKAGDGPEAKVGKKIRVHYTGTLDDGRTFDNSRQKGEPFAFTLGEGKVIRGWDDALRGMKVGEVRRLTLPPEAGYGAIGRPPDIPPDATLHFDVELLGVE